MWAVILLISALVFSVDLAMPLGVAAGIPYVGIVLFGLWLHGKWDVWVLAAIGSVLTLGGYFLSPEGGLHWVVLLNRALALCVIWLTAVLLRLDRSSARKLAETRAEMRESRDHLDVEVRDRTRELELVNTGLQERLAERDRVEYALKSSEESFRRLAMQSPESVLVHDGKRNLFANDAALRVFGAKNMDEMLSVNLGELIPEDRREDFQERVRTMLEGPTHYELSETVLHRLDGSEFNAERAAASTLWDGKPAIQVIIRDISERAREVKQIREAHARLERELKTKAGELEQVTQDLQARMSERDMVESALKNSEETYRRLVEQSPEAVLVHDGEQCLFANDAVVRIFGAKNREEVLSAHPMSFIRERDKKRIQEQRKQMLEQNGASEPSESVLLRIDGSEFNADRIAAAVMWDGRPAIQVILRDITERTRAEEALREAKENAESANAAKSRFLAAASHDLRQPIQALNLFVYSLARKTRGDREVEELIDNIRMSSEVMSNLLNALLDISRLEAGVVQAEFHQFSVCEVLRDTETTFALHAQNLGVELRVVPSSVMVHSDSALLERIVLNYVSNAIRYTREGRILVGCRRRGDMLRIEVWDTGIGISEQELSRVYEEFYQIDNPARDRSKGLGLGLPIIKRTAELLGHEIGARSVPGKGSMFWVEAPVVEFVSPAWPVDDAAPEVDDFVAEGRVLVIDEDDAVLVGMEQVLSEAGFEVVAVRTVSEALESLGPAPELIIADYRLSDPESGIQAIERIQRAIGAEVPGIIITGDTAPERLREAVEGGFRLLHKPVNPDALLEAIGETLPEPSPELVS